MEKTAETITISLKEWNDLIDDSNFLNALRAAGVDNWDGYYFARKMLEEDE